MCLYSYTPKPKKTRRTIMCYKSVRIPKDMPEKDGVKRFESAFKRFVYEAGHTYYEPRFPMLEPTHRIAKGYHSHSTLKEAEKDVASNSFADVILRCEIPAGSWYYTGGPAGLEDYCSDFIRITGWKFLADKEWYDTPGKRCGRLKILRIRTMSKLFSINPTI